MRYITDTQTWRSSATDLANHARCAHLTQMSRHEAREIAEGRAERDTTTTLIQRRGQEHEAAYVAQRRAAGEVFDTQVELSVGSLAGRADLVIRGEAGLEPVEVKLARTVRPEHLLQVLMYADALRGAGDDGLPEHVHVVDGTGERHSFRTTVYFDYYMGAKAQFEAALALDLEAELAKVPEPVAHCAQCPFTKLCEQRREEVDHLSRVARIRTEQRAKLLSIGITTLTQLARTEVEHVPGIGRSTLANLKAQARLQLAASETGEVPVEYRTPADDEDAGRGFALLPEPDALDMFFDFEGYPFHEAGGLEYLWGWTSVDASGKQRFDYLWASEPAEEAVAFSAFLDEVHARRAASPSMHVYHYAPYEITALRRLAKIHQHEMGRLDELLRAGVFVDLYAVVRRAMLVGTPSYSIKKLEPLYGRTREGAELADGGASIEVFEQWLATRDETTRQQIIDYNRDDTDSTLELRDWLLDHKQRAAAEGIEWRVVAMEPEADEADGNDLDVADEHPAAVLAARLDAVADDEARPDAVRLMARLLAAMSGWQWRVRREFFGDLYARMRDREADDLIDEPAALAGLELVNREPDKKSELHRFRFPEQTTIVKEGQNAINAMSVESYGSIASIDFDERIVTLRVGPKLLAENPPHPEAIIGWSPIPLSQLENAAAAIAATFLDALEAGLDPFAHDAPQASALGILAQHATHITSGDGIESVGTDPERIADLVQRADGSHVIVQGPPGTGKTYTSARVIQALVRAGLRVGISSNSHAAIINILRGIDAIDGHGIRAAYPLRSGEKAPGDLDFGAGWITRAKKTDDAIGLLASGSVQLIAGTAWLYAKQPPVDVVLIDEAGQVSLLHATVIAGAASTTVLVGDPQQLPQPSDAAHPEGLEASVLDHLFQGAAVLPADEAVLLDVTYRMRTDVTRFISETYYRGELHAAPGNDQQWVKLDGERMSTGIRMHPVEHTGNRVHSDEEVAAIKQLVDDLITRGDLIEKQGKQQRPVEECDIIVVAPYNAQRVALQHALGPGIRVGTVDKFQGQEAPIAILSMTASSRDDLPRGLEFLLDPHRLNVAISRARSLAIVVCSPTLVATSARTLNEMRLLNDLARLTRHTGSSAESVANSHSASGADVKIGDHD